MKKYLLIPALAFSAALTLLGQGYSHYENNTFNPFERLVYVPGNNFHTSVKSYRMDELERLMDTDSVLYSGLRLPAKPMNFWRRIFHDDLLRWSDDQIKVVVNPIIDFQFGKDYPSGQTTYVNTRGLMIKGNLGKNFHFYTDFYENQASFPEYVDGFIEQNRVVPGQGKSKNFKGGDHDFSQVNGYVSFNASRWINLQLGYGKNFIGDGYRSLILSDNAYSYPYAKLTATFWKIKYMIFWNQMNWLSTSNNNDDPYPKKYGVFHYLNWNIGKRLSVGLFENVVWAQTDTTGYRGFEWAYLNPLLFFRPVEYALGSPDKVVVGLNLKYTAAEWLTLYGQWVFNEFKFDELFSRSQWWANKYAFQVGFRTFNLLGIDQFDLQSEYNQVRPYTYTGYTPITNYGHYNQPLAHPLGANFRESMTIVNYRHRRLFFRGQLNVALYGDDTQEVNYGHNIYLPSTSRPYEYGHFVGQGVESKLLFADAAVSYLINPRNMWNVTMGCRYRRLQTQTTDESTHFYVALRMSLKNLYYDF